MLMYIIRDLFIYQLKYSTLGHKDTERQGVGGTNSVIEVLLSCCLKQPIRHQDLYRSSSSPAHSLDEGDILN